MSIVVRSGVRIFNRERKSMCSKERLNSPSLLKRYATGMLRNEVPFVITID